MSLKAFHCLFIVASIGLSALFGFWCLDNYSVDETTVWILSSITSFFSGALLVFYLAWFLKKLKKTNFGMMTLLISTALSPSSSWACGVCFGDPNSTMVKSANLGILFLLSIISSLLFGFACLFITWARRAQKYSS